MLFETSTGGTKGSGYYRFIEHNIIHLIIIMITMVIMIIVVIMIIEVIMITMVVMIIKLIFTKNIAVSIASQHLLFLSFNSS